MLFPPKPLDQIVQEMKSFGQFLSPYTWPYTWPKVDDDEDINFLKTREETIDGYNVVIYYSKFEHPEWNTELVQITGRYIPFLPFYLVCKIGKKFLGEKHLSYIDFFKDERKVYCWTIYTDKNKNVLPASTKESSERVYEGLEYTFVDSKLM
jgi:hypothetical protein